MFLGGCVRDFGECHCNCHNDNDGMMVHHIMPCCSQCHLCGKRLTFSYDSHFKECKENYQKSMEEIAGRPLTEEEKSKLGLL